LDQCFLGGFQNGRHFISFLRIGRDGGLVSYSKSIDSSGCIHRVLVVVSLRLIASGHHVSGEQSLKVSGGSGPGSYLGSLVYGRSVILHGAYYSDSDPVDCYRLSGIVCTILHSQFGLVAHGVLRRPRALERL
jgi:hypothetical protein